MHSVDRLTIETPEQIELELPLAGIGSRFLALAFDTLLQFVVGFLSFLLLVGLLWAAPSISLPSVPEKVFVALLIFFSFCLYWGYFAFFEIIWKGQTPGKRHACIRVIKDTGRPLNAYEAIARNLMRAVDGLGLYAVGIITMMLNRQHRRLGDYVAGTVVVHDKHLHDFRPDWSISSASSQPESARAETIKLGTEELVLIETYLQRRFELDPIVRAASGVKIVDLIRAKTGLERSPGQSDDDFLESVVRQVRDSARYR